MQKEDNTNLVNDLFTKQREENASLVNNFVNDLFNKQREENANLVNNLFKKFNPEKKN